MFTHRCAGRIDAPGFEKRQFQILWQKITILVQGVKAAAKAVFARQPVEFILDHNQIAIIKGRRRVRILCQSGRAWVTAEGDCKDYEMGPHDEVRPGGWGKIAVTGYGPGTRITILR